jgi:hypothetical protein
VRASLRLSFQQFVAQGVGEPCYDLILQLEEIGDVHTDFPATLSVLGTGLAEKANGVTRGQARGNPRRRRPVQAALADDARSIDPELDFPGGASFGNLLVSGCIQSHGGALSV